MAWTKFAVPVIPSATISRTALLQRLDSGAQCPLTTLVAAAGSGKTALLAQWVATLDRPSAWLSCDSVDADPRAFWDDVVGAVRAAWAPAGLIGVEVLDRDTAPEEAAVRLANDLAAVDTGGVIVLDDFHVAQPDPATMLAFIAALPPAVHLVIATRVAPTFPLGRLRVQGKLFELRQSDLSFTVDEASAALAGLEVHLDATELKALDLAVEGWAAGVHLAGLALRARSNRGDLLRDLAESDHDVADFLTSEIVDLQPPEVQDFLVATAELGTFDAALCDDVLDRTDSAAVLDEVLARSLFLNRVDAAGAWFRYHHLFGAFLRARLRARDRARPQELHRAAARAFVARDDLMSAVRHDLKAGDLPTVSRLLRESVLSHLSLGDHAIAVAAARACLAAVDGSQVERAATEVLDCVAALSMAGAHRDAEPWLHLLTAAELRLEPRQRCQLHTIWAQRLLKVGDPVAGLEHARTAHTMAASEPDVGYAPPLLAVLTAHLDLVTDRFDHARAALAAVGQLGRSRPAVHVAGARALVELYCGELVEADRMVADALRIADELGLDPTNDSCAYAELARAALAIERAEYDEAERGLERTMRIVEDGRRPAHEVETRIHMARLAALVNDESAALAHLDQARAVLPDATETVHARIDRFQLRICLDLGDQAGAEATLARLPPSGRGQLLVARFHLVTGDHATAADLLDQATPMLTTRGLRVEHGVLRVLCLAAARADQVHDELQRLLELAQPVDFVQTIVGEGPVMWSLLEALPTHGRLTTYVARLLDIAGRVTPTPSVADHTGLVDPLTERELTVLRYLASRLDTSGIAEALYLSANTVRSHVKSIYRKLGVNARADAVAQGRRLGLFAHQSRGAR